jgi:uncharacterized protein YjhX (UPF0386 family)
MPCQRSFMGDVAVAAAVADAADAGTDAADAITGVSRGRSRCLGRGDGFGLSTGFAAGDAAEVELPVGVDDDATEEVAQGDATQVGVDLSVGPGQVGAVERERAPADEIGLVDAVLQAQVAQTNTALVAHAQTSAGVVLQLHAPGSLGTCPGDADVEVRVQVGLQHAQVHPGQPDLALHGQGLRPHLALEAGLPLALGLGAQVDRERLAQIGGGVGHAQVGALQGQQRRRADGLVSDLHAAVLATQQLDGDRRQRGLLRLRGRAARGGRCRSRWRHAQPLALATTGHAGIQAIDRHRLQAHAAQTRQGWVERQVGIGALHRQLAQVHLVTHARGGGLRLNTRQADGAATQVQPRAGPAQVRSRRGQPGGGR